MHVLIADDDGIARKLLENLLRKLGFDVISVVDGQKAWESFCEHPAAMVISDWLMPAMDGLTLCQKIRAASNKAYTYIIIVTAKGQKSDVMKVFEAGADDYISKPFDPEELQARIKTGLRIYQLEARHRQMQRTLLASRNKLRVVFDALQEKIVAIDRQGLVVSANHVFFEESSLNAREVTGRPYFSHNGQAPLPGANHITREMAAGVFESGRIFSKKVKMCEINGQIRYKQIDCLPLKDDVEGVVFQVVFVFKDITEEHRHNQHIATLNKKLQQQAGQVKQKNRALTDTLKRLEETQSHMLQTEKMASIGQLAAGVAHEINNPTGFVNSNLKTLLDYQTDINQLLSAYRSTVGLMAESGNGKPPELAKQLKRLSGLEQKLDIDYIQKDTIDLINDCHEGTSRIKKIVSDLKDFSHPAGDQPKIADINQGILSTLNVVNNELKYKAKVSTDLGRLPLIKCMPQQLNQVIANILINAVQAIEKQGQIHIRTQHKNSQIEIAISDTGQGIEEKNLAKIFDPFFTTKDVGQGTGLGMHIAYNIVQKHHGAIRVESTVGKGTTFTVCIPAG